MTQEVVRIFEGRMSIMSIGVVMGHVRMQTGHHSFVMCPKSQAYGELNAHEKIAIILQISDCMVSYLSDGEAGTGYGLDTGGILRNEHEKLNYSVPYQLGE